MFLENTGNQSKKIMTEQAYTLPVFKTQDYTIFKKLNGNRELYPNHIKRLVKLIGKNEKFTEKNPIVVNERMEIIDGQHRLAAFESYKKEKGISPDIFYLKVKGLKLGDARSMNAGSKAWLPKDYAKAYALEGNVNYKIYLEFLEEFGLSHHVLQAYLDVYDGGGHRTQPFRDGLFKVTDKKKSREDIMKLMEVGEFFKKWKSQHFANAFIKVLNSPRYNHQRMLEQMKSYSEGLENIPARQKEMTPAINMVYSWRRKDKVDLLS